MHDVSCVNEGAIRELTVDELAAVSGGAMMCALMWFGDHLRGVATNGNQIMIVQPVSENWGC
jgi:hypothetical protein